MFPILGELIQPPVKYAADIQTTLEGIVETPSFRVSDLPYLTEAERHQLLMEWNDTRTDYPSNLCIHHLFEARAERTPEAAKGTTLFVVGLPGHERLGKQTQVGIWRCTG